MQKLRAKKEESTVPMASSTETSPRTWRASSMASGSHDTTLRFSAATDALGFRAPQGRDRGVAIDRDRIRLIARARRLADNCGEVDDGVGAAQLGSDGSRDGGATVRCHPILLFHNKGLTDRP
jgi:hypothetical protein